MYEQYGQRAPQHMRDRAIEQVKATGRKGLLVDIGCESRTLMELVEEGVIYQEIASSRQYRFTHPDVVDRKRRRRP